MNEEKQVNLRDKETVDKIAEKSRLQIESVLLGNIRQALGILEKNRPTLDVKLTLNLKHEGYRIGIGSTLAFESKKKFKDENEMVFVDPNQPDLPGVEL